MYKIPKIPNLEIGDKIKVGDSIYRFDKILDINSEPKLVFVFEQSK